MKKSITLLLLIGASGMSMFAQEKSKFDIYGDYSYVQFNPAITGLQSRAFNGAGGGFQWNFARIFGIKGDFQSYASTQWTQTVTSPIPTSAGIIPIGTYKSNGNMFTYLFGPVVQFRTHRATFFGEILFGSAHTTSYAQLANAVIAGGGKINAVGDQNPFTMAVGGGIDLNVNKHFAIRVGEFDYLMTRYTNIFTSTNNQNSFRYLGGVVFKFGGE